MGILIKISKYKKQSDVYYYKISTLDFEGAEFFIGINSKDKSILFFEDNNHFTNPVLTVFVNEPNVIVGNKEFYPHITGRVLRMARRALLSNEFSDDISFCA